MDETIYTLCTDDSKTYDPRSPQNQLSASVIDAARESVVQQFEAGYKTVLMQTPYPPDAVVAIPNSRKSTRARNYLADVVQATMTSLRSGDELARGLSGHRLEALFVAAQRADVDPKYQLSLLYGLPDTISQIELEVPRLPFRRRLIQIWGTSFTVTEILSTFKKYVENDRRTIGNSAVGSIPRPELAAMSALERKGCRCAQLVADLTFIMAQIFLLKIQKAYVLEALIKEYTGSDAFRSIQEGVIKIYRSSRRNRQSLGDGTRIVMPQIQRQLEDLVRRVSSNAADRFRLLIIGKPGDAKVTILHKVLGEGSLSTVPKISNEYRIFAETTSSDNGFLVVHDADEPEGQKELCVITQFMASRRGEDLKKQLHAIWYILELSGKTKITELPFFAVRHEVPVVAIICLPFEMIPEDALRIKSAHAAALKQTAYPPEALVMVIEPRKSTPKDSQLTELIQATIELLRVGDKIPRDDPRRQLENLFVAAQMADVRPKRHLSLSYVFL
ncbi:hypothetical protein DFJ58DRAFT_236732 [Suillus subalutaceus]|uniref:uncharacterized protein n=1 Tax=Suillus subalutaceus TaxID=48586 RepID=UPI001B85C3AF|nr:uncharacterized protein DFJ58DRAFT_236732 [Suillus subalutaceus]KAG1832330.1 hypothetical protein DFJ58DRAFT_236732 [Suillus subalutaceus]